MSRTEKTVVIVGAGALVLWWLLGRRAAALAEANPLNGTAPLLPALRKVPMPISNSLAGCTCPSSLTLDAPTGDYSQGGYTTPVLGAPVTPLTVIGG